MTNLLNIPINKPAPVNKSFKLNVIYFEMKYDTQMGENIAVIGSIDRLGNWDTSRVLNLGWNEGNVWGASLDYKEINDFEAFCDAISKISFSACSRDSSIGLTSYPEETISEPALINERLIAFS